MAMMTYAQQLKHPNWQRRRLERLDIAGFRCENCDESTKTLHVHHREYVRGRMAWEYENDELEVLCESCHGEHHASEKALSRLLAGPDGAVVLGVIVGFAGQRMSGPDRAALLAVACSSGIVVGESIRREYGHGW